MDVTDFQSFTKEARFRDLVQSVQQCTLCQRLCKNTKVFSEANGNIYSKVLFIAEAPGRLGADRTGIPLYGDQTGNNFENLLSNIGWHRKDIFITNSVLCNPREENGNNVKPTSEEIANCSTYLEMTIELVGPQVIVSLGATALSALKLIVPHDINLQGSVRWPLPWGGRILIPLYHPGPRARVHRSLIKQRADFIQLAKLVSPKKGLMRKPQRHLKGRIKGVDPNEPTAFQQVVFAIVQALGRITHFKLSKLLYLADLFALERFGHTLTGEIYLRQQEGPWPPKIQEAVNALDGYEIRKSFVRRIPMVAPGPSPRFAIMLDDDSLEILADVLDKYGHLNNATIKTVTYRTTPMRYILTQEKQGRDMRRVPVIYKDKIAPDNDTGEKRNYRDVHDFML